MIGEKRAGSGHVVSSMRENGPGELDERTNERKWEKDSSTADMAATHFIRGETGTCPRRTEKYSGRSAFDRHLPVS